MEINSDILLEPEKKESFLTTFLITGKLRIRLAITGFFIKCL